MKKTKKAAAQTKGTPSNAPQQRKSWTEKREGIFLKEGKKGPFGVSMGCGSFSLMFLIARRKKSTPKGLPRAQTNNTCRVRETTGEKRENDKVSLVFLKNKKFT